MNPFVSDKGLVLKEQSKIICSITPDGRLLNSAGQDTGIVPQGRELTDIIIALLRSRAEAVAQARGIRGGCWT